MTMPYSATRFSSDAFMTEAVPNELLDAVVTFFRPLRVILFGSAARGDAGPDSDIDLLVLVDDDTPPERLTLAAGYQSRRSFHRATDVIPCRESVPEFSLSSSSCSANSFWNSASFRPKRAS